MENEHVGARTGLLDQLAVLCGRDGAALRIDFRDLTIEPVPLELGDWRLVTLDSGASHEHAGGGYNERRAECAAACEALGVASLRDATSAGGLPDPLDRRVRHVLGENARVEATAAALEAGDLERVGALLSQSHASLRDDYEASVPEVERTVEALDARRRRGRPDGRRRLRRLRAGALPARREAAGRVRVSRSRPRRPPSLTRRAPRRAAAVNAHARKSAPTSSIASPVQRFTLTPAALSTSASEAPMPRTNRITP